jgi:hypothetical protein
MLLPARAGKQLTTTASYEGSDKRTEMTCGLRRILSKSKFEKTLLLGLVSVDVAIGWVSLGHEQRPSI